MDPDDFSKKRADLMRSRRQKEAIKATDGSSEISLFDLKDYIRRSDFSFSRRIEVSKIADFF